MDDHWIFRAISAGDFDRVSSSIDADPSLLDLVGGFEWMGLLYHAEKINHSEMASFLRDKGCQINIFEASALSDLDLINDILTETPEMVNAWRNHYYATPLHCASSNLDATRLLLKKGADIHAINTDEQQHQAIHMAVIHDNLEMLKLLLDSGADVNASSNDGTALHCATKNSSGNAIEMMDLLIDKGANISSPVKEGLDMWTPLHEACKSSNLPVVEYLIKKGADISAAKDGLSPLFLAESCHLEQVKEILKTYGA